MMHSGRTVTFCLIAACFLLLNACGLPKSTWVRSEKVVATSAQGESVPVNIRFFQLKHWKKFREAALEDLWTDASKALGEDLLGESFEFTVHPSAAEYEWDRSSHLALPVWEDGCKYLGVILLTSKAPKNGSRRAIMAAKDANSYDIVVNNGTLDLLDR